MPSSFFCPACGNANPYLNGAKPSVCQRCNANFAFAKFSSAPQPVQVIYKEAPAPQRRPAKAHYIEEPEDDFLEELDTQSLEAAFKVDSGRPVIGVKMGDVVGTGGGDNFARQAGPILSADEIKQRFSIDAGKKTVLETRDLD